MSLFVRKDIGSLLAEAGAGTLRRELGPLALVTLGIGAVIGAGSVVRRSVPARQCWIAFSANLLMIRWAASVSSDPSRRPSAAMSRLDVTIVGRRSK